MIKYIDAEAFFKVINTLQYKDTSYPDASAYNGAISDVADMLTHFPVADVAEVRHGRWIKITNDWVDDAQYVCSCCGRLLTVSNRLTELVSMSYPYCNCGAKMDEVSE